MCSYSNTNAQLLKKLTSKIGGKNDASFAHLNEVNDELKVSGQYTSLEPISIETASGFSKKVSTFGLEFNKEKDGDIVNELTFYMTKSKTFEMKLKESWKSKFNQVVFYHWSTSSYYTEFIQLEPGVMASTTWLNLHLEGGSSPCRFREKS